MMPTRKQFRSAAESARSGEAYQIKIAQHWELGVGHGGFYWADGIFESFNGHTAIFVNKVDPNRRIYVEYRDIKIGRMMVVWDRKKVFSVSSPNDILKNNVVGMWPPDKWRHY